MTTLNRAQQLVARIKKSSKYSHQAPLKDGGWFDVRFGGDSLGYSIYGNSNQYRVIDLAFGVRLDDGKIVKLK